VPPTASRIFDFLEHQQEWTIEKYEVSCRPFSLLRKAMRMVIVRLSETGDTEDPAYSLRAHLAELLTVPVPFDATRFRWIEEILGAPDTIEGRWGRDVRESYNVARDAAGEMGTVENPLRLKLREILLASARERTDFRIYCHRRAREHFKSIAEDPVLSDRFFLHSVKDYREAEPFDALIKVGPLRSKGWGSAPDAVVTAPKFPRLIHLVWSGCADEDDFGYDPALISGLDQPPSSGTQSGSSPASTSIRWNRGLSAVGDNLNDGDIDVDDLRVFHELSKSQDLRKAACIQIDDKRGILLPPEARVLSFDPAILTEDAIDFRIPVETLEEGMFVIWPDLDEPDIDGVRVVEGRYSVLWKQRLRDVFTRDPNGLLRRLSSAGIDLQHLRFCVRHWCKPPSNVIHAPQHRRHFEILIRVLGIDFEEGEPRTGRHEWWQYAWKEIAKARGEAIQSGLQEQEVFDEQLIAILRDLTPTIRERSKAKAGFAVELPSNRSFEGGVQFYRVLGIEEGFMVPDVALWVIAQIEDIEQWRV
jgi:hypothetical protein